jgi:DNA-directed RNA polymerase subunit RPC12/RpoP
LDLPNVVLRQPERSDWIRTGAFIAVAVLAVLGFALGIGREHSALSLAGIAAAIALLIRWHAATFGYRCPHCGRQFSISAWADLFSPNNVTTKYVKCPGCGRREWMEALVRESS